MTVYDPKASKKDTHDQNKKRSFDKNKNRTKGEGYEK